MVMGDCVLCEHPRADHDRNGCINSRLRGRCECTYVDQPPLPPGSEATEYRARSDWWHAQAQNTYELAHKARFDLPRWRELMRFHMAARKAELAARRAAIQREAAAEPLALPSADGFGLEVHEGPEPSPRLPAAQSIRA